MNKSCEVHGRPLMFICKNELCQDFSLVCTHPDCLEKHVHDAEVNMIPVERMITQIVQRRQYDKERLQKARSKMRQYVQLMRQEINLKILSNQKESNIVQKIIMQIKNLNPNIMKAIEQFTAGQFDMIDKKSLSALHSYLQGSFDKSSRDNQIDQLQREIENKFSKRQDVLQYLLNSSSFRSIFALNIYNSKSQIRVNRFESETSSWTFGPGKIDAIQFITSQTRFLKGFIHFTIIDYPVSGIQLKVTLYKSDQQVAQKKFKFLKPDHQPKEFQVAFDQPILLQANVKYDLSSQNIGVNFQARHGSNTSPSTTFKFFKSKKDNNGTGQSSGQFKALTVYKPF